MECENLRQSILLLPTTDDLRKVQHHTFSNIKQFKDDNERFRHEFGHQKEIIRRYDEVIS